MNADKSDTTNYGFVPEYIALTKSIFGKPVAPLLDYETIKSISSFPWNSKYFDIANKGIFEAEMMLVSDLLQEIRDNDIPGAIVEFGIFEGAWLQRLFDISEAHALARPIFGFDSFEGLSVPNPASDVAFWEKGMFAAGLEKVSDNLKISERPRIRLVKGWFSESLQSETAKAIDQICYARIDCDIHDPAAECLRYLSSRLTHGSIIVFDDWSHNQNYGETKAFFDWVPTVPHLEFEFIYHGTWDHFYIRVWHKGQDRFAVGIENESST